MDESTGWGGEFWFHDGTELFEALRVTEVDFPEETVDEHDVTTLKATNKWKEFISGMRDGGSFTVKLNYIPGNTTDQKIRAWRGAGENRAWKIVVPGTDGTAERQFTGDGFVAGYKPDPMSANSPKTITLTVRVSGEVAEAVAS